jgi:hypothetical protein
MTEFYAFRNHPLGNETKKIVSSIYRNVSRTNFSASGVHKAQERIIDELLKTENAWSLLRSDQRKMIQQANTIATERKQQSTVISSEDKSTIGFFQRTAKEKGVDIANLQYRHWLLRYVGDGIAWRMLGYRRDLIRALGGKQPINSISGKDGLNTELKIFNDVKELGRGWVAVLHDLTNCLRTSDLSVFYYKRLIRILEIKQRNQLIGRENIGLERNKPSARQARQEQRLYRIFNYLSTGNISDLFPDVAGKLIRTPTREIYNFPMISKVLGDARRNGSGIISPEPGLLYISWNTHSCSTDQAFENAIREFPEIFSSQFTFRSISPRSDEYYLLLPITAMEISSQDVIDIIFGTLGLITIVNFAQLENYFQIKGIPLKIIHDAKKKYHLIIESTPYKGEVMDGLWDRLLLEGLSLDSFYSLISDIYRQTNEIAKSFQ